MISSLRILFFRAKLKSLLIQTRSLLEIFITTKNWWAALAVHLGMIESAKIKFRGKPISYLVSKRNWHNYYVLRRIYLDKKIRYLGKFKSRNHEITDPYQKTDFLKDLNLRTLDDHSSDLVMCQIGDLKLIVPFVGIYQLNETLVDNIYGEIACDNAVVIDVGAFVGDSSLLFAVRGAKKVVAFEPVPELYDILKQNVKLNEFDEVIQPRNEAISDSHGYANIGYVPWDPGLSGEDPDTSKDITTLRLPAVSLSEIIMSLGKVDLLKIDCEGCEHKALQQAAKTESLERVRSIIVEAHSNVKSIIQLLLKVGFRVNKIRQAGPATVVFAERKEEAVASPQVSMRLQLT